MQELSAPYSPESNGKTERLNRTLLDMARTMLMGARHISGYKRLWAEAVNTAKFLRNRLYTTASNDPERTPYETLIRKRPEIYYI